MYRPRRVSWEELRHNLNCLHIYALLCKLTKNRKKALKLSSLWERTLFYRILYSKRSKLC